MVLRPSDLKKTIRVALIVGTIMFAMNQLDVVIKGKTTAFVWFKVGLTSVVLFCVSDFGILIATRREPQ